MAYVDEKKDVILKKSENFSPVNSLIQVTKI